MDLSLFQFGNSAAFVTFIFAVCGFIYGGNALKKINRLEEKLAELKLEQRVSDLENKSA